VTLLPAALGGDPTLTAWRLDTAVYKPTWDSGEGARLYGGRWNSRGRATVYCCLDPACAILEVAVHKGFRCLDTVPHVLTCAIFTDTAHPHIVRSVDVPNPNWLRPGTPSAGQQEFGDDLLTRHSLFAIPSAVSTHSWNLIFDPIAAKSLYQVHSQEPFALDTRLNPPTVA
jgi:RES domain-containing protein